MPGIVGFTHRCQDRELVVKTLRGMQTLVTHLPDYRSHALFHHDQFACTCTHSRRQSSPPQPLDDEGILLWCEGEIYNPDAFGLPEDLTAPELLLRLIRRQPDFSFLAKLDGVFAAVVFDPDEQRLHLFTDRAGMSRLCWSIVDGELLWASESKAMLAHPDFSLRIDRESLRQWLDRGLSYLRGERTWFEGVSVLPLGTVMTWDLETNRASFRQLWSWQDIEFLPERLDPDEVIEELGRLFLQAVRRRCRTGERVGLQLSGGLDSRAILAAMPKMDYPIHALTFGTVGSSEIEVAAQVAQIGGAVHHPFYLEESNWLNGRSDMVWQLDGELNVIHAHFVCLLPQMKELFDVNLSGYLGDATIGGSYINAQRIDEREHLADRGRRLIRSGERMIDIHMRSRQPFFDVDFIDLTMALPISWRRESVIYNKMLLRFFPRHFQSLPWEKTKLPAATPAALTWKRPTYPSFHPCDQWLRRGAGRRWIEETLFAKHALFTEFVTHETVEEIWRNHLSGAEQTEVLGRYLTLEIWLQQVFENKFRPPSTTD